MSLVSVIIPVYNRQEEIAASLASVTRQSHTDLDIIVVDDGSKDATVDVAAASGDPRIRILRHDHNQGSSVARNTGLAAMRGQWVAFLDSDDIWTDPNKIEIQLTALTTSHGAIKAVTCDYDMHHRNGWVERKIAEPTDLNIFKFGVQRANLGSCFMTSREAAESTGSFRSGMRFSQDVDWLMRFVKTFPGGVHGIPRNMVSRKASPLYGPELRLAAAEILDRHANFVLERYGRLAARSFKARQRFDRAFAYHQQGRKIKSLYNLTASLLLTPEPAAWCIRRALRLARHSPSHEKTL